MMPIAGNSRVLSKSADRTDDNESDDYRGARGDTGTMNTLKNRGWVHVAMCGLGLLAALTSTGCQITEGGQTLPSPYYLQDDIQYFPHGPEFKLSREAAAMKEYKSSLQLNQGQP